MHNYPLTMLEYILVVCWDHWDPVGGDQGGRWPTLGIIHFRSAGNYKINMGFLIDDSQSIHEESSKASVSSF